MNIFNVSIRNFLHFFKANLPLFFACFIMVSVISTALFSGDSLEESLAKKVESRLSKIETYITSTENNFFSNKLLPGDFFTGAPEYHQRRPCTAQKVCRCLPVPDVSGIYGELQTVSPYNRPAK